MGSTFQQEMDQSGKQEDLKDRAKVWWGELRRLIGYIPLTAGGLCLALGLSAALYYQGIHQLDLVALAAGAGVLIVLALSIIAVILGTLITHQTLRNTDQPTFLELMSGKQVLSGYALRRWWYVPLVRLDWEVLDFSSEIEIESHKGYLRERLRCQRRGLKHGITRKFTVSDTLGLASISWTADSPGRVRVLPYPGGLAQPNILLSLVSGEDISDPRGEQQGDRVDMRQYQKGDPMKFILWKVYSRSGKVMVRVPERALSARPRSCCYLLSGPGDEASAALARVLLEMRMLGREWRFGADGRAGFVNQLPDALDLVALSGNVEKASAKGLHDFLKLSEHDGYGFCLVLCPPGDKELARDVTRVLASSRLNYEIWIGIDTFNREREDSTWLKSLRVLEETGIDATAVQKTWGGQATLIERDTGRVLVRTERHAR